MTGHGQPSKVHSPYVRVIIVLYDCLILYPLQWAIRTLIITIISRRMLQGNQLPTTTQVVFYMKSRFVEGALQGVIGIDITE